MNKHSLYALKSSHSDEKLISATSKWQPSPAVVQRGAGHTPCKTGLSLSPLGWRHPCVWLCGRRLRILDQWGRGNAEGDGEMSPRE